MSLDEGKLRLYLDGELSEPEREQIETELAHSPKAQAILAELRRTRETVEQALDSLAPVSSAASPAASALKRLKAHLIPTGPSPAGMNETSPEVASPTVWESPTLLADVIGGFKTMRSGPTDERPELQRRSKIALTALAGVMTGIIALVLALWLLPDLAGRIWQVTQPLAVPFAGGNEPESQAGVATRQIETLSVLVAIRPIKRGTQIRPGDVAIREWPTANLPPGVITDEAEVIGNITRFEIVQGQLVLRGMLAVPSDPDRPDLPADVTPISAVFNDEIELVGYKLPDEIDPRKTNRLTLYWQSLRLVETDYTMFVHIIDPTQDGAIPAQWDGTPLQGTSPTSSWQPGTVIKDDRIVLPLTENFLPGIYQLVIGLYDSTGLRAPVTGGVSVVTRDDTALLLTQIRIGENKSNVTALITSSPPPTGTLASHGIQVDPLGDTAANLDHLRTLGFGWVKFRMPWKEVEPEQNQYEWELWDSLIHAYAANDNKVMLSIVHAPDWARPEDDDRSVEGLPADPATYADFVAEVAKRYQGRVQAIEVWNEQNVWYKVGGRGRMDAAAYVRLLQAAYEAIKAANQDMIVISGGLSPAGNVGDLATDDIEYLEQMYAGGFKGSFDVLGAYPSGYNCPALADWRTVTPEEAGADSSHGLFTNRHHSWCFLGTLEGYREVMLANDDGDTPIWVTQFGWAVSDSAKPGYEFARDNTPEEQARWIVEAYQWADAQEWVGSMFLFNLDYGLTAADTSLADYGILDRPAYDALVALDEGGAETALADLAASATPEATAPQIPISPPLEPGAVRLSARHGIQADPLGDTEANIAHLQTLGFGWVKFQMAWKEVEPERDQYEWERWDTVIKAYADSGIKVMLSIPKAPDWARPDDDDKSIEGPPADPATYAGFVAQVAGRYQGQVRAIEIWNEQNVWYEAGGRGRVDAANYVELLKQSYEAIKAVNPDMIVISGALTPAGNVEDLAVDDIEYLEQMYGNGARGFFDVLGAHPSGYNCPALADWRTVTPEEAGADPDSSLFTKRYHSWCFLGTMEGYREVMLANGDGHKAIWPTEFGWAVANQPQAGYVYAQDNTPQEQAQWIIEAYQWAEAQPWVGPMFLWNLDYGLTASGTELADFGIIGQPAYYALANESAARSGADFELKNVRQLTPCENQGRNHLFVKVQDPLGNRLNGMPVRIEWGAAPHEFLVTKTGTRTNLEGNPEPGLVDVAMAAGTYSVHIEGSTSEVAAGLTADYGVEEPCGSEAGNSLHHVSFEVIFERVY